MDHKIIVFPEYEKLVVEIKELKEKLCGLLNERDELHFVICKNIEADYMVHLGSLEIALYKMQCKVLRLKRKLSMIQQRINRREPLDERQIEACLDDEFQEYQKKLDEKIKKLDTAIQRQQLNALSDEDTKELKQLYYKIVKHLHPDLNPDATEAETDLFYRAVDAYHKGDLMAMRIIAKTFVHEEAFSPTTETLKELVSERDALCDMVESVQSEIACIKTSFPYNMLDILTDPEALDKRRKEYEAAIEAETELYQSYKNRIAIMLRRL